MLMADDLSAKDGVVEETLATSPGSDSGNAHTLIQSVPEFVAAIPPAPALLQLDTRSYRLLEPLGKGGMGEVYQACDPALGRELAVKVIKAAYRGNADVERRFVREARVTGSLQHPGIVPVHNLGRLADGRLHYTMRLVSGQTFSEILATEVGKADRLPGLLSIFEKICQAVAYAHSKHVIHRDLKPANVMVGRFGEVQVMDWGLAKVLMAQADADGGEAVEAADTSSSLDGEVTPVDLTRMGSGLGTPAYMAPEQAMGEWRQVDERADVFSLGSILCQILTGKPVYSSQDSNQVHRQALRGDVSEARLRLQQCGADAALVELCQECLSPERDGRPRDAGVVAGRVGQYQADVQERLRRAELERVAAETRAQEEQARAAVEQARAQAERRARRQLRALVVAVGTILCLALGASWWIFREREARTREELERMESLARINEASKYYMRGELLYNKGKLEEALVEYRKSIELQPDSVQYWDNLAEVLYQLNQFEEAVSAYEVVLRLKPGYAIAYHSLGDALWSLEQVDRAMEAYQEAIRLEPDYAEAYDDLGDCLRNKGRLDEAIAVYHKALALQPDLASAHNGLGNALRGKGQLDEAIAECHKAARLKPEEATYHKDLGYSLGRKGRLDEALAAHQKALELRPGLASAHNGLGDTLADKGRLDEAIAEYQKAIRLAPREPVYSKDLAVAFRKKGLLDEAIQQCRQALRLKAIYPEGHNELAIDLELKGQLDEAIDEYRQAIRLKPESAICHTSLANCLRKKGRRAEALAACREALRLAPDYAEAHNGLGNLLDDLMQLDEAIAEYNKAVRLKPTEAVYHSNLGLSLRRKGRLDEAIAACRKAITLRPDYAEAHNALALALDGKNRLDEAIPEYRQATRLKPTEAIFHNNLGMDLRKQGQLDEAMKEFRAAIRLKPELADGHNGIGNVLLERGDFAGAARAYRQAIQLKPDLPVYHSNLGHALLRLGEYAPARECWARALQLATLAKADYQPLIEKCDRYLPWVSTLSMVLQGEEVSARAADTITLAEMCVHHRRPATAARLYAEAFAADPSLAGGTQYAHRYNAACYAALAAARGAEDGHPLPDRVVCLLRRWSLQWLRSLLSSYVQLAEQNKPEGRQLVRDKLALWRHDADLASVRESSALSRLPEEERAAWRALWRDVEELAKRVTKDVPK
jgi:serine/threonine-protein kinase